MVGNGTSVSLGFSGSFLGIVSWNASGNFGSSSSTTWTQGSSSVIQNSNTTTTAYSITGPQLSDNYTGPATYNVYVDDVYGTYAFYSDLEPQIILPPTPITVSASSSGVTAFKNFGSVAITTPTPTDSASQKVYVTNNTIYQMTMAAPAITFTDPGFQIANDGNDFCSNQVLAPAGQCSVDIVLGPVPSDLPNAFLTSSAVNAMLIAAGTVNASSYQNVLATGEAAVAGTATSTTPGVTLACTGTAAQGCGSTVVPNIYQFLPDTAATAQTDTFTFTNTSGGAVTVSGISLTSSSDETTPFYSVLSDKCTLVTVPASGTNTCTFTLQFLPNGAAPASPISHNTRVTVQGTEQTSAGPLSVKAIAGASGLYTSAVTFAGMSCFYYDVNGDESSGCTSEPKITNNTSTALTSVAVTVNNGFSVNFSSCTTIPAYGSCTGVGNVIHPDCTPNPTSCTWTGTLNFTAKQNTSTVSATGTASGRYRVISKPGCGGGLYAMVVCGSEQSKLVTKPATAAKGKLTVTGKVKSNFTGTRKVAITVGTYTAKVSYNSKATNLTIAKALAAALNATGSPVTAKSDGGLITLTSTTPGTAGNLAYTVKADTNFAMTPATGSLTGGKDEITTTVYDSGKIVATVGTATASATWGAASTPQTIAKKLAAELNAASAGLFKAAVSGSTITITPTGSGSNPAMSVNVTDAKGFTPASFTATAGN